VTIPSRIETLVGEFNDVGAPIMEDILDPPAEARIIPLGEPIEGGQTIFEGSLIDAHAFLESLSPDQRGEVAIWTPGHVFTAAEFAAERPGHEHDPLTPAP
jgi:hypothetical protein